MTSKAFGLAQLGNVYSDGALSNRNKIINGAMQVWQRGTSITAGSDTYTVDRWAARNAVISQSTDVPAGQGFKYSLFYDNGGISTTINVRQKIEDGKILLENREVTLSFWLKASVNTTITVDWTDTNVTNVPVTTSWQHYTVSFPASAINPNNIFVGSAWIDFNFRGDYPDVYITGVQLEAGDTATPFEHRSYGQELALCMRYYETSYPLGFSAGHNFGQQYPFSTSKPVAINLIASDDLIVSQTIRFAVQKRSSPTVVIYSANDGAAGFTWTYKGTSGTNLNWGANVIYTAPDLWNIGQSLSAVNQANESYFHFTANAEL